MTPEAAMEQYIGLLSEKDPGWTKGEVAVSSFIDLGYRECDARDFDSISQGDAKLDTSQFAKPAFPEPDMSTDDQPNSKMEKILELKSGTDGGDMTGFDGIWYDVITSQYRTLQLVDEFAVAGNRTSYNGGNIDPYFYDP
ncbi:hypothetical protein RJ639_047874 [Escallonia herrerae]|uniref:ACB domain-containing protein n=1 Tax=Escallonia herrerae TaxID=1293975 RepID=A0AA89B3M8_9ASTE|nr:hypothetical protein RJ639_047874 [Escallonia herrerae]